ncbi:hypothetical protein HYALB_00009564 [Hymenoscyphus albidus]|uniref:Zn(2)-C6 fungal-type domain-containing protein n=1 Tax=Hymenoscyphus albidus TaxID=595503 RepID=A0A9N9LK84_9HELO|nr:hypothetical protein HYALB_00009564 [Hymenoscyphus albidus]
MTLACVAINMAYPDQNGGAYQPSRESGYSLRDQREHPDSHYPPPSRDPRVYPESQYPPPTRESDPYPIRDPRDQPQSQYPPPPGEEDDRARAYHHPHHRAPPSSNGVTLPPLSPYETPSPYGAQQPPPQHANGYPPVPQSYPQGPPGPYSAPQAGYRNDRPYQQPAQDYGRPGQQHMAFSQSAPRQRTAIACRYCRRRKIRCSGFDANPEGRCSNCVRFQQDCFFAPVSSQAQAFVPAHTVYPHMRQNSGMNHTGHEEQTMYPRHAGATPQLYGAHGQPLGPVPPPSGHGGSSGHGPGHGPQYEYPAPSPTGSYNSMDRGQTPRSQDSAAYSTHDRAYSSRNHETLHSPLEHPSRSHEPMHSPHDRSQPPRHHEPLHPQENPNDSMRTRDRPSPTGSAESSSRKRPSEDQHDSVLPPPMPPYARSDSANRRQALENEHRLPPLTPTGVMPPSNHSPGSSIPPAANLQSRPNGLPSITPPLRNNLGGAGRTDPMNLNNLLGDFNNDSRANDDKVLSRFNPNPR